MSVNKKKGLGRGLDALLGASNKNMASEFGGDNPSALPLNLLQAGKYQPRQIMDETPLKELADSIRERGVIQPLLVRGLGTGRYEIIAGERRFRAASIAGLKEVPVRIVDADDQAAAAMALIENMQREDLARALLSLPGSSQVALAQKIVAQGLSVRETERLAASATLISGDLAKKKPLKGSAGKSSQADQDLKRLAQNMADIVGLEVEFKNKGKGGELRFYFSQFDELDALMKKLGIESN